MKGENWGSWCTKRCIGSGLPQWGEVLTSEGRLSVLYTPALGHVSKWLQMES